MDTAMTEIEQRNETMIELLASGFNQVQVASELGVSDRTIRRALEDEGIRAELAGRRAEKVNEAVTRLNNMTSQALDVLADSMASEKGQIRLRAAQMTLDWSLKLGRDTDLREQLTRIEGRLHDEAENENDEAQHDRPDDFLPI